MPKAPYAQVAIESALPQLDRYFDYAVPPELQETIRLGQRVRVPFGRAKTLQDAIVVGVSQTVDYVGKLGEIAEVVSRAEVLTPEVLQLCRAVADRQAATLADVLSVALPARSVAVEKRWLEAIGQTAAEPRPPVAELQSISKRLGEPLAGAPRLHQLVEPRLSTIDQLQIPTWVLEIARIAAKQVTANQSTIVVVPDFRDHSLVREFLNTIGLGGFLRDYTSEQTKSAKYGAFLETLSSTASIVLGSRSAIFAPAQNLGSIVIWDDGDPSLQDQGSPYAHARDIALIRQSQSGCQLLLLAHSISADAQRLLEIGYFDSRQRDFAKPRIALSDGELRVDSNAIRLIREATERGAALIQVAAKGHSSSAFCASCSERTKCTQCNGPIWLNQNRQPSCRWCNAINLGARCRSCGSTELRFGRAGSTRTAAELGRMFPGVQLIESTHETKTGKLSAGRKIVVATPGAEPDIDGGYAAVVLLDCTQSLGKDSLRASEDAIRNWSNAVAKLSKDGRAVAVALGGELGQSFALWNQANIARNIVAERRELGFPPAERLLSATGSPAVIAKAEAELSSIPGLTVLGKTEVRATNATEPQQRILARYAYSAGHEVSQAVMALQLKLAAGAARGGRTGRASRALTVKMDDGEVV